ncbi:MAG: indole-3-glycerol phosphate synthase TrpC, partial [Armatimonadota bacterium]
MNKLKEIFAYKSEELSERKLARSFADVRFMAADAEAPRGFHKALTSSKNPVALIAEVKKASPSQGLIRADFDPVEVATDYEQVGADCLSVLTDEKYFEGSEQNLRLCKEAVKLPILRKDFTSDPYHIYEARAMGADAILLIVAGLSPAQLLEYRELAESLGMDVLVEVHTAEEADIAINSGAKMVG